MLRRIVQFHDARLIVVPVLVTLGLALCRPASAQNIGHSQADLPVVRGEFTLTNSTSYTITYLVRWGNRGFWDKVVLPPGWTETHSHGLDGNLRAPVPHIQFQRWNNGLSEIKSYRMDFYVVSDGMTGSSGTPKPYYYVPSDAYVIDVIGP
jgi:hypothetical protein